MSRRSFGLHWSVLIALASTGACGLPHPLQDGGRDGGDVADVVDADGDAGPTCPSFQLVSPAPMSVVGGSSCGAMGFVGDVQISTTAPAGTPLDLLVNGSVLAHATVQASTVVFPAVQFGSSGAQSIQIRVTGTTMACGTPATFTINCGTPTCNIAMPMGGVLNLSNNVTGNPATYAVAFEIQTNVEDGQPVVLQFGRAMDPIPQMLTATAASGVARFPMVPLSPDDTWLAQAHCTNAVGSTGFSSRVMYTVDTHQPTLMLTDLNPPGDVTPRSGSTVPFNVDVDSGESGRQFHVCVNSDGVGGTLVAQIHGSMPDPHGTSMVPAAAMQPACVEVTCPSGAAAFDVDVSVTSVHGNATTQTITGVSCASSAPSVRIISPTASVMGMPSTYYNAASNTPPGPNLHLDVVACSDQPSGNATLLINGSVVGTPVALGAATAACAAAGFRSSAVFSGVAIPESSPRLSMSGTLPANPTLQVNVDGAPAGSGSSPTVTLYVDTIAPTLTLTSPMCGAVLTPGSSGDATADVLVLTTDVPTTLTINNSAGNQMLTCSTFSSAGQCNFVGTTFHAGDSTLTLCATDVAGNTGCLSTTPCRITVGNPPALTFTSPMCGSTLNASTDADSSTPGYQGATIALTSDAAAGSPVALTINGGAPINGNIAAGSVSFTGQTLPEGADTLAATVTDSTRGVGHASCPITVDTVAPAGATGLAAMVVNRRAGSIRLSWTTPMDPAPGRVSGYNIRWSTSPITTANFGSGTAIPYTSTPPAAGSPDQVTVTGLQLGFNGSRTYYFAIQSIDAAGNLGPIVATTAGVPLDLSVTTVTESAVSGFGVDVAGGFDVNGDMLPDVIVGSLNGTARVYYGAATGGVSLTGYTEIDGASEPTFGRSVASLGDINGDGLGDFAIAAPAIGSTTETGSVYVFFGRADSGTSPFPRPGPLSITNANVTISGTAGSEFDINSWVGFHVARANVNGDGFNDLVISAPLASPATASHGGDVAVVLGRSTFPATLSLPADAAMLVQGTVANGFLGRSLSFGGAAANSTAGDAFLVGANAGGPGTVHVFAGRTLGGTQLVIPETSADFTFTGTGTMFQLLGFQVGDINGDGIVDLAVGGLQSTDPLLLLFGTASGGFSAPTTITGLSGGGFGVGVSNAFSRTQTHPSLITPSATAADLGVGETLSATGSPHLYLFSGRPTASWTGVTSAMADASYTMTTSMTTGSTIAPVNWVGDVNGDGFDDLAAGQSPDTRFVVVY